MTPERATELYRTASTPAEAAELLEARGLSNVALLVSTLGSSPARGTAALFRDWAAAGIVGDGWYEPGRERAIQPAEAKRKILAAFRWLGDVFERYAAKQVPIVLPPDEPPKRMKRSRGRRKP